jgi:hypothetical protein
MLFPVHMPVLDAQHLPLATAGLQRPDDAVVHRGSYPLVFRRVHRQGDDIPVARIQRDRFNETLVPEVVQVSVESVS